MSLFSIFDVALMGACHSKSIDLETVEKLVDAGANINVRNLKTQSCLDVAFESKHYHLLDYFFDHETLDFYCGYDFFRYHRIFQKKSEYLTTFLKSCTDVFIPEAVSLAMDNHKNEAKMMINVGLRDGMHAEVISFFEVRLLVHEPFPFGDMLQEKSPEKFKEIVELLAEIAFRNSYFTMRENNWIDNASYEVGTILLDAIDPKIAVNYLRSGYHMSKHSSFLTIITRFLEAKKNTFDPEVVKYAMEIKSKCVLDMLATGIEQGKNAEILLLIDQYDVHKETRFDLLMSVFKSLGPTSYDILIDNLQYIHINCFHDWLFVLCFERSCVYFPRPYVKIAKDMVDVVNYSKGYKGTMEKCINLLKGNKKSDVFRFIQMVFEHLDARGTGKSLTESAKILTIFAAKSEEYLDLICPPTKENASFSFICSNLNYDTLAHLSNVFVKKSGNSIIPGVYVDKAVQKYLYPEPSF